MKSDIELTLILEQERWTGVLPEHEDFSIKICNKTLSFLGKDPGTYAVSVVLADDPFVQQYNLQYRGKNKPTNVLSFPADTPEHFEDNVDNLGDILISLSTLEREALEQKKKFQDHYTHMLTHGILHLLGYDHITDEQAEEMESLEINILQTLGVNNPYTI